MTTRRFDRAPGECCFVCCNDLETLRPGPGLGPGDGEPQPAIGEAELG